VTRARPWAFEILVALLAVVAVSVAPGSAGAAAADPGPMTYRPPLTAPVVDPFRPPPEPWAAGNRGLEYGSTPGSAVGAIGPGLVVFAGPVAGALYVTVLHPDGLRSSYSYLAAVRVGVGDRVAAGQTVGVAATTFHLGVRDGDVYIDPAGLFGQRIEGGSVYLIPGGSPSAGPSRSRPPPALGAAADQPTRSGHRFAEEIAATSQVLGRAAQVAAGSRGR